MIDLYYGDKSEFFSYDKVVLASHADQALSIIDEPTKEEQEILSTLNIEKILQSYIQMKV